MDGEKLKIPIIAKIIRQKMIPRLCYSPIMPVRFVTTMTILLMRVFSIVARQDFKLETSIQKKMASKIMITGAELILKD